MGQKNIFLWAVAGAYLVYLGVQQLLALISGEASVPWLNALAGIVFLGVGGAVLLREWRAYRAAQKGGAQQEQEEEEDGE